jgi:lipid-A-disaccharide synthase-like uncharacterized protein
MRAVGVAAVPAAVLALVLDLTLVGASPAAAAAEPAPEVIVDVPVPDVERVELGRGGDGRFVYTVRMRDGETLALDPEAFSAWVAQGAAGRSFWHRVLNVRSPLGVAWVALGLAGQLAFMTRMLVQWLASEHRGRSVVPVAFWWISIAGASMLLAYFAWRRDIVGILGQSMGFLIYGRNLWLIHRGEPPSVAG